MSLSKKTLRYVFVAISALYVVALFVFAIIPFSSNGSLPSDKLLHFVEFFLLAVLLLVTLLLFEVKDQYLLSFILVFVLMIASEVIQLFVLGRSFSVYDMIADAAGAAAGFVVFFSGEVSMELVQALILGIVQGLSEWLPISSQGMTSLVMVNFFNQSLADALVLSLWLHLGTMLAAIIYFREEVKRLCKAVPAIAKKSKDAVLLRFLVAATVVSLVVGGAFYLFVIDRLQFSGNLANAIIGFFLVLTGVLTLFRRSHKVKERSLGTNDALLTGLGQGFAVFPGISRSGTTTAILLFRKFSGEQALRLSFLMSIPITLVAIFVLLVEGNQVFFTLSSLVALLAAFIVGLLTIKYFMRLAKKVSFGYFALFLGVLLLLSSLLVLFI